MKNKNKSKPAAIIFDADKMLLSDNLPFSIKEAYKTLRTNVMFSLPGNESKCLGVVSADRGDGKSSISINLAISLAQIGKRVIIVDCDLRLPTISSKLGIEEKTGLSNFLSGNIEDQNELIKRSDKYGIDVITSGDIPPDPTTLLGSEQMGNCIKLLKEYYDYIILDFPPITIVSDAVILSNNVDGYLIVVRHYSSEYKKIAETVRQMKFASAKILGVVYNGKSNHRKYYKRSSKYYKTGYYKEYYKK